MADTVRYLMEEMVPELEDMVKQQYFSRAEVKQIVKRRQDFEYLLKRKATLKEDYLRYIEYESKLDALRVHRRQALGVEGKKKKSLADFAIVRRIHFIFERAVRKFKTDLSLWTAWLEFCRASNSNRRLGRVVARALQIHPTEPGLWVYAAAWEFEANANPSAARALMQQGLRMCRYSEKMWLDYFDLELMYVEKLVARRRILGLDVPDPDAAVAADTDNNNNQQENEQEPAAATGRKRRRGADADADADAAGGDAAGEADAAEDGEGPESKADAAAAAAAGQPTLNQVLASQQEQQQEQQQGTGLADAQAAVNAVLTGAVARLVYQQALKAAAAAANKGAVVSSNYLKPQLGSSGSSNSGGLQFRAGFLRVLQQYSSPGVGQLRREVVDSIRQDFPQDPAAADLLARLACDPTDVSASAQDFHAAVQEYERLLGGRSFLQQQPPADAAAGAGTAGKSSSSKGRQASKRQKKAPAHEQEQQEQHEQDATAGVQVPAEVLPQVYRLYCAFLEQRMQALLQHEEHALSAAAVAQQLFKLLLAAHTAGAADEELYGTWVRLATQLQQHKVALKAARLATEAHPSSGRAWEMRVEQESLSLLGCSIDSLCEQQQQPEQQSTQQQQQQQHQQQLFVLVMQALRQVPAAAAVQLWQQGLALAELLARAQQQQHTTKQATDSEGSSSSSSSCPQQLAALQKLLVGAVTAASVRGPSTGGLGEVAGRCLQAIWRVCGAAAARKLWQQLLLLPPAGGDMFRAMLGLEQQSAGAGGGGGGGVGGEQRVAAVLAADAVKRVRGVFEAWASAYGSCDAELWVEWALFEQQQGKAGAGKIYWRAVKALDEPDVFIADYRQRIGAAA